MLSKIRRFARLSYYDFFYYAGISRWLIKRKLLSNSIILTYHNILPQSLFSSYYVNTVDVTIEVFEKHIQWLNEIEKIQPIKEVHSKKGLYISFDDGMKNNHRIASEILKKHDITAMFAICTGLYSQEISFIWRDELFLILKRMIGRAFIYPKCLECNGIIITEKNINHVANAFTDFIQSNGLMSNVYNELKDLKNLNAIGDIVLDKDEVERFKPMGGDELQEMIKWNHLLVVHTHKHFKLSYLNSEDIRKELSLAKEIIHQMTGNSEALVYPYGNKEAVNEQVITSARNAGFKWAYMNEYNYSGNNFTIPRRNMTNISRKSIFYGLMAGLN